jgi:hypothetical protein
MPIEASLSLSHGLAYTHPWASIDKAAREVLNKSRFSLQLPKSVNPLFNAFAMGLANISFFIVMANNLPQISKLFFQDKV